MDLHARPAKVLLVLDELVQQVLAENLKNAIAKAAGRGRRQNLEAGALQQEVNLWKRERIMRAVRRNLAQLVGFGAEKFAARRNVKEKILGSDLRAARKRLLAGGKNFTAGDLDSRAVRTLGLCLQHQPGH